MPEKISDKVTAVPEVADCYIDGVTAKSLGKLKPVFSKAGSTHAGNASQLMQQPYF
ncbi:hypothetical protein CROQUDRAFT_98575 [Cronartium quercuum f. sp. fusiforme G11]|uniref:Thiolase N-terminal domain-containing protein n=1 Tax=Cronartium quercuum f. sp. fusiforme G11 TaxID=708437 RepID=A0A9P6N824_9BASI|nr:hypothetical protein CROQUDRAFT_98575 [Cronartium quercuum f. sp. fusiforme G11]